MNLQRGLRYPMADGNWIVKVLIGSLLSLFPIANLAASGSAAIAILCLGVLMLVVSLVVSPLALVAQACYAVTNNWKAALPGPVFQHVRNNLGAWTTVVLAAIGIVFAVSIIATLLIIVTAGLAAYVIVPLLFVFGFYYTLVQAHWTGQAYRLSAGKEALPPSMV